MTAPHDDVPTEIAPTVDAPSDGHPTEVLPVADGEGTVAKEVSADESTPGRLRWVLPTGIALSVALVALLTFGTIFGAQTVRGWRLESTRSDVVAAAKQVAVNLTTFDADTAEADVKRLQDSTTPDFENGFAQDADAFVKVIKDGKVKMTGQGAEAGLLTLDGDKATAIVAVKAQVSTAQNPQPDPRDYRMSISLVHQDGRWLANGAEFIA
ncbi:hypothetical protein [Pseudonocardia acidicola]|uniref:Nuclear transport factor 2 family protein n=1 Tax=Pseudonocardia acidicola TaxID=2724939 RepID=A0ABX1S9M4_9PSEU|nr:hypothetical protein [Pseudonocardia acidicola]NMH98270.1 nuclear transport factor 2 family protein [Pseudonocardia acidicola]